MKYKVKAIYSRKLIGRVTLQYLIKAMGWSFYTAMIISITLACYLYFSGNRTILLAVFSAVSVFGVLIFLRMFSHYFSGPNRDLKKLKHQESWLTFRENGISFNNETDSLKWKNIYKVWSTDKVFLFFTSKDAFIICPTASFEKEVIQFIQKKLAEFRVTGQ